MTRIVRRGSPFVVIMNSVTNFSAAFENGHGVFLLTAQIVYIVKHIVSSPLLFLSEHWPQTYQLCKRVATRHLQRPNSLNMFGNNDRSETGSRTLDISHFDDGFLSFSSSEEEALLVRVASECVRMLMVHNRLLAPTFYKSGRGSFARGILPLPET